MISPRLKEVGALVAAGLTTDEIAARLGISPNTVAGEPEPPRIRTPPTMIQPPDGGISPSPATE